MVTICENLMLLTFESCDLTEFVFTPRNRKDLRWAGYKLLAYIPFFSSKFLTKISRFPDVFFIKIIIHIGMFDTLKKTQKVIQYNLVEKTVNFRMNLWSHGFFQNMNKKCEDFCPAVCRKEVLTIFSPIFWEKWWLHKFVLKFTDL